MGKKQLLIGGEFVEMDFEEAYKRFEKLIHFIIRKHPQNMEYDELAQIGRITFWKAFENYDGKRGFAFATYAGRWIAYEMLRQWKVQRTRQKRYISLDADEKLRDSMASPAFDSDDVIDVRRVLSRMKQADRAYLTADLAGYSQRAIGTLFGHSQVHAGRRIRQAKSAFRSLYEECQEKKTACAPTQTA